jgi:hypothetical protein
LTAAANSRIIPGVANDTTKLQLTNLPNHYNSRLYNNRNNIALAEGGFGVSYLRVMRDVGIDKLNKAIDDSTATNKNDLKKYAKEAITFVNHLEARFNQVGYSSSNDNAVSYAAKRDIFQKSLLQKKAGEYPYSPVPN